MPGPFHEEAGGQRPEVQVAAPAAAIGPASDAGCHEAGQHGVAGTRGVDSTSDGTLG